MSRRICKPLARTRSTAAHDGSAMPCPTTSSGGRRRSTGAARPCQRSGQQLARSQAALDRGRADVSREKAAIDREVSLSQLRVASKEADALP